MSEAMSRDEARRILEKHEFPFYEESESLREIWLNLAFCEEYYNCLFGDGLNYNAIIQAIHTLFPSKCPPVGTSFIGWKQVYGISEYNVTEPAIAKLEIPTDARRVNNGVTSKCRCERAKVLDIFNIYNHDKKYHNAISTWNPSFKYIVGEEVVPDSFNDNELKTCSHGINFFMTLEEALNY